MKYRLFLILQTTILALVSHHNKLNGDFKLQFIGGVLSFTTLMLLYKDVYHKGEIDE